MFFFYISNQILLFGRCYAELGEAAVALLRSLLRSASLYAQVLTSLYSSLLDALYSYFQSLLSLILATNLSVSMAEEDVLLKNVVFLAEAFL